MSTISAESFIGRGAELRSVEDHARDGSGALIVSAKPGAGSTELLHQAYDRMFFEQGETVPFLFEFKPSDRTARAAAIRFLHAFFVQFTAFRRNDPNLCAITPDVCELSDLSAPSDSEWVNRLIETCTRESELNNESTFIRNAVSAPMRAETEGNSVFCLIGGLEHTKWLDGDTDIFEQLKESFELLGRPYVFSGKRRFIEGAVKRGSTRLSDHRLLELDGLGLEESGALCTVLGETHGVETTPQTRDLIGLQSEGSPLWINALFHSAAGTGTALNSFKNVQQIYVKELMGGRIRAYFDSCFELISPDSGVQRSLVDLIYGSREFATNPATSESWCQTLKFDGLEFRRVLEKLNCFEFVNSTSNLLSAQKMKGVFSDYLDSRFRLEIERASRPAVYGEMLTRALKRAPQLMARFYRRSSSIGLREILLAFNCQETPVSLLFYNVFKERFKGREEKEIVEGLAKEAERVTLPQIVYSVNTVSLYGRLSKFTEEERSAVALGFEAGDY
ncbi:MAG: hypothetical protein OEQ28_10575, partial [Acidobacteriota bacterium]|nr:hypothetical protein [Acidobacteriota bacterium]